LTYNFSSILIAYSWIVAAILVAFLLLIGRFYEVRFGQRSYHHLLLFPLGAFVVAAVWDAFFVNDQLGDPLLDFVGVIWIDLLFCLGGLVLIVLCYSLYRIMMGGRG